MGPGEVRSVAPGLCYTNTPTLGSACLLHGAALPPPPVSMVPAMLKSLRILIGFISARNPCGVSSLWSLVPALR